MELFVFNINYKSFIHKTFKNISSEFNDKVYVGGRIL